MPVEDGLQLVGLDLASDQGVVGGVGDRPVRTPDLHAHDTVHLFGLEERVESLQPRRASDRGREIAALELVGQHRGGAGRVVRQLFLGGGPRFMTDEHEDSRPGEQ
jgi:hypothetical protein